MDYDIELYKYKKAKINISMSDTNSNIRYPNNIYPLGNNIIDTYDIENKTSNSSPDLRPKSENVLFNGSSLFYTSKSVIKEKSYSSSSSNAFMQLANEVKDFENSNYENKIL